MIDIAPAWRLWIAENAGRGVERAQLARALDLAGVPHELVVEALDAVEREPRVLRGRAAEVCDLEAWAPDALAARWGDVVLEVTHDRALDDAYAESFRRSTRSARLRDLVRSMEQDGEDWYLVAQNGALARTPLGGMLEHVRAPASYAAPPLLWLGPRGTLTPFHYDPTDVLVLQLHGRKRWQLIAPTDRAWSARVGDATRTLLTPIEGDGVDVQEHELAAGDAIGVPAGWWHRVVALGPSITLSLPRR